MRKSRRSLLKSMGCVIGLTSVSGCLDSIRQPREDITSEHRVGISNIEADSNPDIMQHDLGFQVKTIQEVATTSHPPQIGIQIENRGQEDIILYGKSRAVFGGETDTNNELHLVTSSEWTDQIIVDDTCWTLEEPIPEQNLDYDTLIHSNTEQGIVLDLIGNVDTLDCLPTGDYRFETYYSIRYPENDSMEIDQEFLWGFTIRLDLYDASSVSSVMKDNSTDID